MPITDFSMTKFEFLKKKFEEEQYETILEENYLAIDNISKEKVNDTNILLILAQSLLNSGYFIKTSNLVTDILNSEIFNLPIDIKIRLLIISCEAYYRCLNFSEGKKILIELKNIFEQNNDLKTEYFESNYLLYKSLFERDPVIINLTIDKLTKLINEFEILNNFEGVGINLVKKASLFRVSQDYINMFKSYGNAIKVFTTLGDKLGLAETHFDLAYSYMVLDDLDNAMVNFDKAKKLYSDLNLKNRLFIMDVLMGQVISKKGELMKADTIFQTAIKTPKLYNNDFYDQYIKEKIADNYSFIGDLEKSIYYYKQSEEHFEKSNLKTLGQVLNKIGQVLASQGKFDEALYYHYNAINIFNNISDVLGVPWTKVYLGQSLFDMGDYDYALNIWLESYDQFNLINNHLGLGFASSRIGLVNLILNNNVQSQKYFLEAIELIGKINNYEILLESYIGLGIIYQEDNKVIESELMLKNAKDILESEIGYQIGIAQTLFKIALLSIQHSLGNVSDFIDLVSDYLEGNLDTPRNFQRKNFIQAVKLNSTSRLRQRAEAVSIFEELTKTKLVDYEIGILSYLFILDSIIFEIKIFNSIELLDEAYNVLDNIIEHTLAKDLSVWKSRILSLQAQLKVFEYKFDEAKQLINEAIQTAATTNLLRMAFHLSNQYDELVNQIVRLEEMKKQHKDEHSFNELLEITEFSIFDYNRNKFNIEIPDEEPSYLSLISLNGVTLYSRNFDYNNSEENIDQLISGFLVAINSVIMKVFSSSGFIERIKHKEYTITLFNLIESIYICYVYKGPSFHAQMKINRLKHDLLSNPSVNNIIEASKENKTLNQEENINVDKVIANIFMLKIIQG